MSRAPTKQENLAFQNPNWELRQLHFLPAHPTLIDRFNTFDHDSSHYEFFAAARDHAFRIGKAGLSQCADV